MLLTMESKTAAYHKLETLIERGRATAIKQAGGIGEFHHDHESAPVDKQLVIRGNLDTLYSTGVWDLDAETADCHAAGRGQAFSFDDRHYGRSIRTRRLLQRWQIHLHSGKNRHTLPRTGSPHLLQPSDSKDIEAAHALQNTTKNRAKSSRQV